MKIAVLLGGESQEREISIKSGTAIVSALKRRGHEVEAIDGTIVNVKVIKSSEYDVVFIALHGGDGENGTVQLILEEKGIVYTGSDAFASRLAMDKIMSKDLFAKNDILTPVYFSLDKKYLIDNIIGEIGFPLILKPISEGSSIGLYLIKDQTEFDTIFSSIDCEEYLIEKYIKGREFTVGILDNKTLPLIEILPYAECFYFKSKYTKGKCEYIFPSDLDFALEKKMYKIALDVFNILGCVDYGRVDLILGENNEVYVLEINTIPGFTEMSLLPKAAKKAGIDFDELCDMIVKLAMKGNKQVLC